jgi:hypothetical protein
MSERLLDGGDESHERSKKKDDSRFTWEFSLCVVQDEIFV